ncbi:hypothetical protein BC834DRAFT_969730 [Gloeopeniophorella convolvens]|nr:hypothetical protein BC834DRAFT_969730 [Gloeopeniophorella convolvens]
MSYSIPGDVQRDGSADDRNRAPRGNAETRNQGIEDAFHGRNQTSKPEPHAETCFTDGSGALFSMYLERAEEEDKRMTESWKGDADGILVFTGLFSATVATFIGISFPSLMPNSQDASAFYLAHIYQRTVSEGSNGTVPPLPSTLSDPSAFSPSASAIWVNTLWFLSLVISLTCALLATLLQQWARRYLRVTKSRRSLHKRAYIRALFAEGVEKLRLPSVVEALPGMLHVSVFLFFAGLVVFLFGVNKTVFAIVIVCVGTSVVLYMCISIIPLVRHDSSYYTPLSNFFWFCGVKSQKWALSIGAGAKDVWKTFRGTRAQSRRYHRGARSMQQHAGSIVREAERLAENKSHATLSRALQWTFTSLDEDNDIEYFLAGIPGLYSSKEVKRPSEVLSLLTNVTIALPILDFMDRSLTSDSIPDSVKHRRSAICIKVLQLAPTLRMWVFQRAFLIASTGVSRWIDLGIYAEQCSNDADPLTRFFAHLVSATFTKRICGSDRRWVPVILRQLKISEPVLQEYLAHGDSLLLASFVRLIRSWLSEPSWLECTSLLEAQIGLMTLMEFDATDALPALQHDFCTLWRQALSLVNDEHAPEPARKNARSVLSGILPVFNVLHPVTDATVQVPPDSARSHLFSPQATSMPLCTHAPPNDVLSNALPYSMHPNVPTISFSETHQSPLPETAIHVPEGHGVLFPVPILAQPSDPQFNLPLSSPQVSFLPPPYPVLAILYNGFQAAKAEPRLLGTVENELGIRKYLESLGHEYIVTSSKEGPDSDFQKHIADTDILITTPFHPGYLTRDLMNRAKNLKLCVTAGVGSDHIDLNAAVDRKIQVLEVSGSNVVSVAEQVMMSILLLVRNFVPAHEMAARGDWQVSEIARNAFDLEGKVVGTLGAGRIGYRVLQRLVPFNCKELLYYDYNGLPAEAEKTVGARRVTDIEEFVSQCDVITVNAPLHEGTRGLINKDLLAKFKPGAWLVNTARGAICVAEDVAEAVRSGQLRGYAGDVWNVQPAPRDHPWRTMQGPVGGGNGMTPHYSGTTLDAQTRYAEGTKTILENFFEGKPQEPGNVIVGTGKYESTSYGQR